jgi:hypothetical protein
VNQITDAGGKDWEDLDPMFPSTVGTPLMRKRLRHNFYSVLEEAGVQRIRFHDLRHTAASMLLNYGIPVLIVSKRLGHTKPSITLDVYGHLVPSRQEEAAQLMDELLTPIDVTNCTLFASMKASVKGKTIVWREVIWRSIIAILPFISLENNIPTRLIKSEFKSCFSAPIRCIYSGFC